MCHRPARYALALCLLGGGSARANGRFPAAQHVVVGPGARSDTVALRTTFGVLLSLDGARTFRWVCEDALYFPDVRAPAETLDPALEISAQGRVVLGFPGGVRSFATGCYVAEHASAAGRAITDLAASPDGATLFASAFDARTGRSEILRAASTALDFTPTGPPLPDLEVLTLDVAPSDPRRLYLSALRRSSRSPVLLRSDDGGAQWSPIGLAAPLGDAAYVSGVSARTADTLYVRTVEGLGAALLRSVDGGVTFARVAATPDAMTGFALHDDGQTVWFGSARSGLLRADDGVRFTVVNPLPILGLRFHGGTLWAASDWQRAFALGRSDDGGARFTPALRFEALAGPPDCASASEGHGVCLDRWPALQQQLRAPEGSLDGGLPEATPRAATPPPGGCSAAPQHPSVPAGAIALGLCAALYRRRRIPLRATRPSARRVAP